MKYILIIALFLTTALEALPRVPITQVARSNNEFALAFFREISTARSNFIYSPYALSSALAIAYLGAKGETEREMAAYLFYPLSPTYLGESFKRLNNDLSTDLSLGLASSLWVQSGQKINDDFLSRATNYFEGRFHEVDFNGRADSSRNEINAWVSLMTKKKIPFLLSVTDVPRTVQMYLVSVLTLQAAWEVPFSIQSTSTEKFFLTETNQITVPMMKNEGDYAFFQDDNVKVLEVPFAQDETQLTRLSFWIILPKAVEGLRPLEAALSARQFNDWVTSVKMRRVKAEMPRFRMNQTLSFKEPLEKIGLKRPFSAEADFTGMTGAGQVYISKIIQKVFFSLNEKGSDPKGVSKFKPPVAASTATEEIEEFRADRPFLFFVYDNAMGQILFLGHCVQP